MKKPSWLLIAISGLCGKIRLFQICEKDEMTTKFGSAISNLCWITVLQYHTLPQPLLPFHLWNMDLNTCENSSVEWILGLSYLTAPTPWNLAPLEVGPLLFWPIWLGAISRGIHFLFLFFFWRRRVQVFLLVVACWPNHRPALCFLKCILTEVNSLCVQARPFNKALFVVSSLHTQCRLSICC